MLNVMRSTTLFKLLICSGNAKFEVLETREHSLGFLYACGVLGSWMNRRDRRLQYVRSFLSAIYTWIILEIIC
jgi:hypothetical protein